MGSKQRAKLIKSLVKQVDEVLFREWDPIGINDEPELKSEYSSYAPRLLGCAMDGSPDAVAEQLGQISSELMGLSRGGPNHNLMIAQKLIEIASQAK